MSKSTATRLTKAQQAKLEAEKKEQERIAAQMKRQNEEEAKRLQEVQDLHDFQAAPRVNLKLKSVFGLNDNIRVNERKSGTTFQFVQSPRTGEQDRAHGKQEPEVQLLFTAGRQLAIRNALTNQIQMVSHEYRSHQITAITAHSNGEQSRIAIAESDFYEPKLLYFTIFEVLTNGDVRLLQPRFKIDMPQVSEPLVDQSAAEERKAAGGRRCEQHGRKSQEFGSAAAASPHNGNAASTNKKEGAASIALSKSVDEMRVPYVSQICFSNNLQQVACLISGTVNRVVVYEAKAGKVKIIAAQNFDLVSYQDEMPASPSAADQSRYTEKSKLSTRTIYQQQVTQISFNPLQQHSLCMTGPNCHLDYVKVLVGLNEFEASQDGNFAQMRHMIGEFTNITAHAWSTEGDYFAICTDDAQLVVYQVGTGIVLHESLEPAGHLVGLALFQLGLVAASADGHLVFYEVNEEGQFEQIRSWQYASDELNEALTLEEGFLDVVRGIQVLDTDLKMLAVQLSDRNVLLIDMWNEIYSKDKRLDIQMKLQEHREIEDSSEEKARFSRLNAQEKIKAKAAREKEKEKITAIDFRVVANGAHAGAVTEMHVCQQRPVILTMSQEDQTVRLWNYVDNQCELKQNFALGLGEQKPLVSCALHPSGYYMAVALADQIRLYHVLHPDLKQFNSYDFKNTRRIRFSAGGQYLCAIDHKNVHIFSTYSLERVRNLQIPPTLSSTIAFNFNDSRVGFVSGDGQMQCFDLEDFSRLGELRNDRAYSYRNAVFASHVDLEDNRLIVVGSKKDDCASLRIFEGDEMSTCLKYRDEFSDQPDNTLCYTDVVKVVSARNQIENLIVGTNRGSLLVYGMPPRFLREDPDFKYGEHVTHFGEVASLQATVDGKYVFSAGQDGIIFMYEALESKPESRRRGTASTSQPSHGAELAQSSVPTDDRKKTNSRRDQEGHMTVETDLSPWPTDREGGPNAHQNSTAKQESSSGTEIQDELARIVLVGKGLMEEWRKEQETLRTEMEKQQDIVDSSLRAENFSFIQRNNAMEKETTKMLNELNRAYEELQMEEAEQKDENQQQMNKLEINHNQCKEELQDLYEKKLEYEQEQFRRLKEAQNDEKRHFEAEIKRLNDRHDADVEELLDDFKIRLQDVQGLYEDSKKVADDLKMKNEEKLTSQEQDQLHEIEQMTSMHREVMDKLKNEILELKNEIEREKYHENKIVTEIGELKQKTETIRHITEKLVKQGREYEKKSKELDQDKKDATQNLKKKEDELFSQKFKIKDLQKTKQVLTHRTFEMKASLEPKEQQIESLKQNLHDLEKLFDMQAKSLQQMEQNVRAKEESKGQLERKRKQAKILTKKQEHKIQEFVGDIQKTMQKQDDDDKLQGFMAIYTQHVKKQSEEVMTKKQKDPELIDQLDKHLKYMEKQIRQLQDTSSKKLKKAKDHINQRTDENKNLIVNLTDLRAKDKMRRTEQGRVDKKITEISLAKRRIDTEILKMKEEMQKMKIQEAHRPGLTKASSVYNAKKDDNDKVADQFRRSQSRGKLIKGSLYNHRPAGMYKQQIIELLGSLDEANETIVLQNLQITTLRDEFEAARRELIDGGAITGGQPNEAQRHQFAQLRSELENLQVLTSAQQQQFIAQQMAEAAQQQQHEAANQMQMGEDIQGANQDQPRSNQRQDIDGQPADDSHFNQ